MHVLGWILAITMIGVGILGTVVPGLPGTVLVFGGLFTAAWMDHFNRVGPLLLAVLGFLSLAAYILDAVAVDVAVKSVNASRFALIGAVVGTLVGASMDFVGVLFMPFVGAMIGELVAEWDVIRAGRVGIATWLGMILAMAARLALAFTMIGIFIIAFLWRR